jgi:hypothetical protein
MIINIIQPDVPSSEYIVRMVQSQLQIWKQERKAAEQEYVVENVRFEHNPQWRNNFWSIQSAHDGRHWFWQFMRVAYVAAGAAPYVIGLL